MYYNCLSEIPQRFKDTIIHSVNVILDNNIENLSRIILFGSCAKLSINMLSDVDIVVETDERLQDIRKICVINSESDCNDFNTNVDIVFASKEQVLYSDKILFKEIRRDGINLWKEGVFTHEYKQLFDNS